MKQDTKGSAGSGRKPSVRPLERQEGLARVSFMLVEDTDLCVRLAAPFECSSCQRLLQCTAGSHMQPLRLSHEPTPDAQQCSTAYKSFAALCTQDDSTAEGSGHANFQ